MPTMHTETAPADRVRLALDMACRGLPVFPLMPGGKYPYNGEGVTVATTDPARIRAWFAARPTMNYGCATTDFVVLDVDCKHGQPGLASLERIGALPHTLQQSTPSGGLHIVFGLYDAGQSDLAAGINVRSRGGYIVGPGSELAGRNGDVPGVYRITCDADIAPLPSHVARLLRPAGQHKSAAGEALGPLDSPESIERGRAYLETLSGARIGGRDNDGYRRACTLKDYGLSGDKIAELLADYWNPKNSPPLSQWEIEKIARNAMAHGQNPAGVLDPANEFEAVPDDALPALPALPEAPEEPAPAVRFRPFVAVRDPRDVPRRPWLVHDLLMRGHLTTLISPGGIGKSSFALGVAVGLAVGDASPLGFRLAHDVPHCPVVLISTEDDDAEQWRRLYGYCARHGVPLESLEGRLHVFDGGPDLLPFKSVARDKASGQLQRTKLLARLGEYVGEVGAGLVVFDPFVETHDANENDNAEIAAVMAAMRGVCRARGAAGLVVHHSRKIAAGDVVSPDNAARGAGSLVYGARLNFMLSRPSPDDCAALGLSDDEAAPLFRLDRGKGNYLPPGRATRWYRTVSVAIPNGDLAAGVEDEHTHAVEIYDTEPARARMQDALDAVIADAVAGAGGEISLADATRAVLADPVLGAGGEKATRQRLEETYSGGRHVDGCTVRLVIYNPESARPRRVLKAV